MDAPQFNFIIDCSDDELREHLLVKPNESSKVYKRGDMSWCLQTYLFLSTRKNLSVICSNSLKRDCINIIHSDHLLQLRGTSSYFVVCVRADYPMRIWAHYHLVQNKNQLTFNTSYIPHWVQPGLIKRDSERREITRVGYAGQVINGNLAGGTSIWQKLFETHNIEFVTMTEDTWHDLSSIDALIGVRTFDKNPHNTKPPTKLFNAWHAQIPFIGGYDSAFMQVGTPGKDYLLAQTPEEVIEAVVQLKKNPYLYLELIKNGSYKATEYNQETIAKCWEEILGNEILNRFKRWKARPWIEQTRFNLLLNLGLKEHNLKQTIKRLLLH